ncbi:hypothetical protein ACFX12_004387 [Malus domestica]
MNFYVRLGKLRRRARNFRLHHGEASGVLVGQVSFVLAIPLLRLVEESDEDLVVQELDTDHEPLHLVVDIDRDVAIRDYQFSSGGSHVPKLHTERFVSTRAGGGISREVQKIVLRGVGDAGQY